MKNALFTLAIAATIFLVGCGTTSKFSYPDSKANLVQIDTVPLVSKPIAVIPFEDDRSKDNSCCYPMYWIPLMPTGWAEYNRPETADWFLTIDKFDINPSEDLAKAAVTSLKCANIFQDAFFTFGGEKKNADFVLSGRIKVLKYESKEFSYGLSVFGRLLWILFPEGTSENKLALELQIKDKQGRLLWSWSMEKEDWFVQWLYGSHGRDCSMISAMYQEGMNEAMKSLTKRIKERPDIFK